MGVEDIRRAIAQTLEDPEASEADKKLAEGMRALDVKDAKWRVEQARIIARDAQREVEMVELGQRIGAPVGQLLAERGVNRETRITDVLPVEVNPTIEGGVGIFGEVRGVSQDRNLWNLGFDKKDLTLAVRALNTLARLTLPENRTLEREARMGIISDLSWQRGLGPHIFPVLNGILSQLPQPPLSIREQFLRA